MRWTFGYFPRWQIEQLRQSRWRGGGRARPDLTAARDAGCKTQGGMPMLVWQAAAAQEIWLGVSFAQTDIERVIASATEYMNEKFVH